MSRVYEIVEKKAEIVRLRAGMTMRRACWYLLRCQIASSPRMMQLRKYAPSFSCFHFWDHSYTYCNRLRYSTELPALSGQDKQLNRCQEPKIRVDEARRFLRLVNVEAMKRRLESYSVEFMPYADLLGLCQTMGVASSDHEAKEFAKALDEAGVIFIFRDKVYLHPQQVAELVENAVPISTSSKDDPCLQELQRLRKAKDDIDRIAQKKVRTVLWSGLGFLIVHTFLFARISFWELSWDVMEPVSFFLTSGGFIIGYTYFLVTCTDPSYQDFVSRLFRYKQQKLLKRRKFNIRRLIELEKQCVQGRS